MSNECTLVHWPGSQLCIDCQHGDLVMSDTESSLYVCHVNGHQHWTRVGQIDEWVCDQYEQDPDRAAEIEEVHQQIHERVGRR